MKKAVIFDLDGVLVHTDRFHYAAWRDMAQGLGISLTPSDYDAIRGLSRMDSLDRILALGGLSLPDSERQALAERKNAAYLRSVETMTPDDVTPDARSALAGLRAKGLLLAVGSSSKNAPLILERTALRPAFDAVADGSCVTRAKPDPEVFLAAARLLGVSPADAMVVEDAVSGLQAAKAGGFSAAAFGPVALQSPLADHRLERLSDLLDLV